jgi:hypothetical protein
MGDWHSYFNLQVGREAHCQLERPTVWRVDRVSAQASTATSGAPARKATMDAAA